MLNKLLVSVFFTLAIYTILFLYLFYHLTNDLLIYPALTYGLLNDTTPVYSKPPLEFLKEKGIWPVRHLFNNVLVFLIITGSPLHTFLFAVLWEIIEAVFFVVFGAFYPLFYDCSVFTSFIYTYFYESIGDSVVGDLFQSILAIFVCMAIVKAMNLKYETTWFYRGRSYWRTYVIFLIYLIFTYISSLNFIVKNATDESFLTRVPVGIYVTLPLELMLFLVLKEYDLLYIETHFRNNELYIKNINNKYTFLAAFYILQIVATMNFSLYVYATTWCVSGIVILFSFFI